MNENRIYVYIMKKIVFLLIVLATHAGAIFAQEHGGDHEHEMVFSKPDAYAANLIVWISVGVVLLTLYITLKYIFFPGEKDPNHIKNIVKDEYFK